MSESPPPISVPAQPAQPGNESTSAELTAESFLGVVIRRTRYVVAMLLSAWLFCTVGWQVARPPADWGGVSLMVWWGGAGGGGGGHRRGGGGGG
ncbi:MAG: hypothetical protein FWD61_15415, partial [Phycisphaerales bacterium]|nr:hypothetical protein [Phycisphaerales bacterium]